MHSEFPLMSFSLESDLSVGELTVTFVPFRAKRYTNFRSFALFVSVGSARLEFVIVRFVVLSIVISRAGFFLI